MTGLSMNLITRFAFQCTLAIYLNKLSVSPGNIGLISVVYFMTMRLFGPFLGALIDIYGCRICLATGYLFAAAGYFICSNSGLSILFVLGIGILGLGIGTVGIAGETTLIHLSKTLDQGNRAIALYYIVINLAASVGPLLSSIFLIYHFELTNVFHYFGVINLILTFAFYLYFPFSPHMNNNSKKSVSFSGFATAWNDESFRKVIISLPPVWFLFSLMQVTVPVFLLKWINIEGSVITTMFTIGAGIVVIFGYPVNRFLVRTCESNKRSYIDGLMYGSIFMGLGFFALAFSRIFNPGSVIVFIILFTFGEVCFIPMISLLVNKLKPNNNELTGSYFGMASLTFGVGQVMSNLFGGFFVELCCKFSFYLFPFTIGPFAFCIALIYYRLSNTLSSSES